MSWIIQTNDSVIDQSREHVEIYKNKISNLQSKYVALHIGLFWGIGVFKIKNEDVVKIKLDEKIMLAVCNCTKGLIDKRKICLISLTTLYVQLERSYRIYNRLTIML